MDDMVAVQVVSKNSRLQFTAGREEEEEEGFT